MNILHNNNINDCGDDDDGDGGSDGIGGAPCIQLFIKTVAYAH